MSIGENKVINELVSLDVYGKVHGKMDHFGTNTVRSDSEYLKKIFHSLNDYLNNIAFIHDNKNAIQPIVKNLGLKSGFFFIGDIINSKTWKEKVYPMVNNKEDYVLSCISVLNSMGMGKWKIRDFQADESLVLNIYNSFEMDYYKEKKVDTNENHIEFNLSTGIATSIMSLIYDTDITKSDDDLEINMDLYNGCFDNENSFYAREVRITETNNTDYCEIIVERKNANH